MFGWQKKVRRKKVKGKKVEEEKDSKKWNDCLVVWYKRKWKERKIKNEKKENIYLENDKNNPNIFLWFLLKN
jgi:hypothetical protein